MPSIAIDLDRLSLDEFGRVVLGDDLLDRLDDVGDLLSAGGLNGGCPNSTNTDCTNGACTGSSNGQCSNMADCSFAWNNNCPTPPQVPE